MTEFDSEIDRFMLDCAANGLALKNMKSYEQTFKVACQMNRLDHSQIDF